MTNAGFISSFVFRHFWRQSHQNQLSFSGKDSTADFFRFSSFTKNENGMKRSYIYIGIINKIVENVESSEFLDNSDVELQMILYEY